MISANELNYYKKNGYVVINNFFSKSKIDKIRLEILSLAKKKNNDHFYYENLGKQKVLRRIERISQNSAKMNKILKDIKLKITLKQLTGLKSYLFKDKLNFKFPGAGGFDPHIDGHFLWKNKDNKIKKGWSVYGKKFINVVIPLEKSFLGSSWSEISNKLVKFTPKIKSKFLKKVKFRPMILNQGDVMFFDWKVMHHSKKNLSKKSRMIFYATYINSKESKANVIKKYYLV